MVRTGSVFTAGPAGGLARGGVHAMLLTKGKGTAAALLVVGIVGWGAARFARPQAVEPGSPSRGVELERALSSPVTFKGFDDPKTTLIEGLDALAKVYNVTFDVNEKAFAQDNLADVLKAEVVHTPIPEMRAPLRTVLGKVLGRIPNASGAILMIRKDVLEITTEAAVRAELGIPDSRPLPPLVYAEFEDKPLAVALKTLASASGLSVVLNGPPVTVDKGPKVTADFHNVPIDTAVRVLAEMAELGVVRLDNVLFVTTREKAARLQGEKGIPSARPLPAKNDKKG
jgi:hypothetical protein